MKTKKPRKTKCDACGLKTTVVVRCSDGKNRCEACWAPWSEAQIRKKLRELAIYREARASVALDHDPHCQTMTCDENWADQSYGAQVRWEKEQPEKERAAVTRGRRKP